MIVKKIKVSTIFATTKKFLNYKYDSIDYLIYINLITFNYKKNSLIEICQLALKYFFHGDLWR